MAHPAPPPAQRGDIRAVASVIPGSHLRNHRAASRMAPAIPIPCAASIADGRGTAPRKGVRGRILREGAAAARQEGGGHRSWPASAASQLCRDGGLRGCTIWIRCGGSVAHERRSRCRQVWRRCKRMARGGEGPPAATCALAFTQFLRYMVRWPPLSVHAPPFSIHYRPR